MKKHLFSFICGVISTISFSQTATNFNCNDCSSNNHDLYAELNSGKVIVIAWVMPCVSCINGALTAYTEVQNFPGQAYFYLADDNGNTSCATLTNWANTNGMSGASAIISNSVVNMSAYGTAGMPKVVVIGSNKTVYYNENNSAITSAGINAAISTAVSVGVNEYEKSTINSLSVYPNPSNTSSLLSFKLLQDSKVAVEIQNLFGQKVAEVYNGHQTVGENTVKLNTADLKAGNYFVICSDGNLTRKIKLTVIH